MILADPQTEEVAEHRRLQDSPELPPLPRAALIARLNRAAPLLTENPQGAIDIMTAPLSAAGTAGEA